MRNNVSRNKESKGDFFFLDMKIRKNIYMYIYTHCTRINPRLKTRLHAFQVNLNFIFCNFNRNKIVSREKAGYSGLHRASNPRNESSRLKNKKKKRRKEREKEKDSMTGGL